MKRLLAVLTTFYLLSLLIGCQQTPSDAIADLAQTSIVTDETSFEYIVFESLEEFLTQVEAAEKQLQHKGVHSKTLSSEATTIKANGFTAQKIYVPTNLIAKYGLVGVEMNQYVFSYLFPSTQEASGISFTCMLSLDPAVYPIEDSFPIGRPIDSWTFLSAETNYFVQVDMMFTTPTAKLLTVSFAYDGQMFVANLPYGTSNEDIATLLTLEPASTIDDKSTK